MIAILKVKPKHTTQILKDGEPCDHSGCLNHVFHPCEGCGRVAGKGSVMVTKPNIERGER